MNEFRSYDPTPKPLEEGRWEEVPILELETSEELWNFWEQYYGNEPTSFFNPKNYELLITVGQETRVQLLGIAGRSISNTP